MAAKSTSIGEPFGNLAVNSTTRLNHSFSSILHWLRINHSCSFKFVKICNLLLVPIYQIGGSNSSVALWLKWKCKKSHWEVLLHNICKSGNCEIFVQKFPAHINLVFPTRIWKNNSNPIKLHWDINKTSQQLPLFFKSNSSKNSQIKWKCPNHL